MSLMMSQSLLVVRRALVAVSLCAVMVGLAGNPAQARVFIGIGVPFFGPGYYPAPYYYPPPPVYYAPPPAEYPPQAQNYSQMPSGAPAGGGGQACYAGSYVCPMDRPVASGASCYCLGNGAQKVWGKAN
jgi:hypothetical protein